MNSDQPQQQVHSEDTISKLAIASKHIHNLCTTDPYSKIVKKLQNLYKHAYDSELNTQASGGGMTDSVFLERIQTLEYLLLKRVLWRLREYDEFSEMLINQLLLTDVNGNLLFHLVLVSKTHDILVDPLYGSAIKRDQKSSYLGNISDYANILISDRNMKIAPVLHSFTDDKSYLDLDVNDYI